MMHAKKTNTEFIEQVEKNKVEKYIQERKHKRSSEAHENQTETNHKDSSETTTKKQKTFKQHRSLGLDHGEKSIDKNVMVSILGKKNISSS